MANRQPLWFYCGLARLVGSSLAMMFYMIPFVQEDEVLLRLWAECSWSSELNAKSVKERLWMPFSKLTIPSVSEFRRPTMIFQYFLPGFYSSDVIVEICSEACKQEKKCACRLCKCCMNCCNKCSCIYANIGADESIARQLLPSISIDYL